MRGCAKVLIHNFSNMLEILSKPTLLFWFESIYDFYCVFLINFFELESGGYFCLFKYDSKLGFPVVFINVVRLGPIFMKKLLKFSAISDGSEMFLPFMVNIFGNSLWRLDLFSMSVMVRSSVSMSATYCS